MNARPVLIFVSVLAVGCRSAGPPAGPWTEDTVHAPSERVLWQLSLVALQNLRFPIAGGLDPSSGVIESGWKTQLHPFQGEGFRERAEIRFQPVEPGVWRVRVRVRRQTNESLTSPLDPTRAEWEWAPDDERIAQILLQHVRSRLGDELELSDEPDPRETLLEHVESRAGGDP